MPETTRNWFELSDAGWRSRAASRPLASLVLEAVQNAFDERAERVSVRLSSEQLSIEDDAPTGFVDERMVYTVFLSNKPDCPDQRGRLGRGLKELLASMQRAEVQTVGTTLVFDAGGRTQRPNQRTRGTRLLLQRSFGETEIAEARRLLRCVLSPKGVSLRVDGKPVRPPTRVLSLSDCELPTVVVEGGRERVDSATCRISVYTPRQRERGRVYEMGIPICAWDVPYHVDVGQRVPLREGRDQLLEGYARTLKGRLLEAMMHRYMEPRDLRADWVHEVVTHHPLKRRELERYVSQVFPRGAVLASHRSIDDRATQLGAHVIAPAAFPEGMLRALGRVLERSDAYVRRREAELGGHRVEADATMERFGRAVRRLCRELTGVNVEVGFFAREPTLDGMIEDAVTEVDSRRISFNVRAALRFDDLLDPRTFGIVLHELAHLDHPLHDARFIDRLQQLSGQAARWLAQRGPQHAAALARGEC